MKEQYRICISSPPDRNKLVAEIFFGEMQWAEVNQEHGTMKVEFYPRSDEKPWQIDFCSAIDALNEAKQKLLNKN